jgi:hypothetical protein
MLPAIGKLAGRWAGAEAILAEVAGFEANRWLCPG